MHKLSLLIKEKAKNLGFGACGMCKAEAVDNETVKYLSSWLARQKHGEMGYLENYFEKRINPALLLEENSNSTISAIVVAQNYYPKQVKNPTHPKFAYYAYGSDYHPIMKTKLQALLNFVCEQNTQMYPNKEAIKGRVFCDTAPLLEKYLAQKAGLGWIGKNTLLILPNQGSFFFLGVILVNIPLHYDQAASSRCGNCTRCIEACPTGAIEKAGELNATKCTSYLTIEHKSAIPDKLASQMKSYVFGCDICALVCPWNRFARAHSLDEFDPSEAFLQLDREGLEKLSEEEFRQVFKHSAVKRTKYAGLQRNLKTLSPQKEDYSSNKSFLACK